jgi:hypothetical protein
VSYTVRKINNQVYPTERVVTNVDKDTREYTRVVKAGSSSLLQLRQVVRTV